jgi:phage terminase Nu1 subunit (DNA packaging protein)
MIDISSEANSAGLLIGAPQIARFLGIKAKTVRTLEEKGRLPVFRLEGRLAARRSALLEWIAEQERSVRKAG